MSDHVMSTLKFILFLQCLKKVTHKHGKSYSNAAFSVLKNTKRNEGLFKMLMHLKKKALTTC